MNSTRTTNDKNLSMKKALRNVILCSTFLSLGYSFANAAEDIKTSSVKENSREVTTIGTNRVSRGTDPFDYNLQVNKELLNREAKPAWEQKALNSFEFSSLRPFGEQLFKGNFASTYETGINSGYKITTGDRILVRFWGAKQFEDILTVDAQGNIFIPEVGPVTVAGITNGSLLATIKAKVSQVFTDNVDVYVNLQSSQPVAVFVTGFVNNPGRYAGMQDDNVLSYIDRAGGIVSNLGSYRKITVKRNGSVLKNIDLYDFILKGNLPLITLQNNDVILIEDKDFAITRMVL